MEPNELEKLMLQKEEIERKIRELKNSGLVRFDTVKLDKQKWGTSAERWMVAVKSEEFDPYGFKRRKETWKSIINGHSRQEVIDQIPNVIKCLQALYDMGVNDGKSGQQPER